jgi:glycosyltransferase involved in cell wall biosynthesis
MSNVAVLLPSYKRKQELEHVLNKTYVGDNKFIVVANYPEEDYNELSQKYSDRAVFVDETKKGKLGVCGAYNLAFETAKEKGFTYCVLFADDVVPFKQDWLDQGVAALEARDAALGVFSSDEGHYGSYGWNIIKDAPIGHFFIARIADLGTFFSPKYRQYVIDLEIVVRILKEGKKVLLLPIRVNHMRSPLNREEYGQNYDIDLKTFVTDYPEYNGWMNSGKELFVPESKEIVDVQTGWTIPQAFPWPAHKQPSSVKSFFSKLIKGDS